jgi:hypothetical protein
MARLLQTPLAQMQAIVDFDLNKPGATQGNKYLMYSLHDFQIALMLKWLQPVNFQWFMVPYASQFFFELYKSDGCTAKDETCFYVKTTYNSASLGFKTCQSKDDPQGQKCSFPDFKTYLASISPVGNLADLCNKTWPKPQQS